MTLVRRLAPAVLLTATLAACREGPTAPGDALPGTYDLFVENGNRMPSCNITGYCFNSEVLVLRADGTGESSYNTSSRGRTNAWTIPVAWVSDGDSVRVTYNRGEEYVGRLAGSTLAIAYGDADRLVFTKR